MITHFYHMTPMGSVAVHIHEGDVLCPLVFAFADEPNVFYRRVEVSDADREDSGYDKCDDCDAGTRHCNFSPRCGQGAPVLAYSQDPTSLKISSEHRGFTPDTNQVYFLRTYDYRPFVLNSIPVTNIDI